MTAKKNPPRKYSKPTVRNRATGTAHAYVDAQRLGGGDQLYDHLPPVQIGGKKAVNYPGRIAAIQAVNSPAPPGWSEVNNVPNSLSFAIGNRGTYRGPCARTYDWIFIQAILSNAPIQFSWAEFWAEFFLTGAPVSGIVPLVAARSKSTNGADPTQTQVQGGNGQLIRIQFDEFKLSFVDPAGAAGLMAVGGMIVAGVAPAMINYYVEGQ